MILHEPLGRGVVGVRGHEIGVVRRPDEALRSLLHGGLRDELLDALKYVIETLIDGSGISTDELGVFGSLLHGFYHPRFSDLDIIVYGGEALERVRGLLQELYTDEGSKLSNEFEGDEAVRGRIWRFKNITPKEFVWHQRRKIIYGVYKDERARRRIKVELEPVKRFSEIKNDYGELRRINSEGWVKTLLRVEEDSEAPYMPSIYRVEPLQMIEGPRVEDLEMVVSYLEEFRMQAWKGEVIYAEGNLERVETSRGEYHQITLTYGPRYYEQVIKLAGRPPGSG